MNRPPFTLARHTASILATQGLVFALQLLALWLVAVGWGEAGTGAFGVVTTVQVVFQGVFSLGVAYANTCFAARDPSRRDELHTTTVVVTLAVSAVVVPGLILGRHWLSARVLRNVEPDWLLTVAVSFPFALYAAFITALWVGEERIGRLNKLEFLRAAVFLAGVLTVFGLAPGSVSLALWAWAGSFIASGFAAASVLWGWDRVGWAWRPRGFVEALRFSLIAYLGDIASNLHQWFGLFVVNYYLKGAAVGAYYLALRIASYFWVLASAVRRAGARRVIGSDQAPSWDLVAAMTRVTLWALLLPTVAVILSAPWVVPAVFRGFAGSVRPLQLLLPACVLVSCAIVLGYYVIGNRERPGVVTAIAWVGLGTNVVLSFLLVRPLGVTGVGLATGVSYSLSFLLLLPVFRRWGHRLSDLFIPSREDLAYFQALGRHLRSFFGPRGSDAEKGPS
jgi:O-antigen/teichoic acid export membrane protein